MIIDPSYLTCFPGLSTRAIVCPVTERRTPNV